MLGESREVDFDTKYRRVKRGGLQCWEKAGKIRPAKARRFYIFTT
jgi:hypothetical protein